ncbi:MAG: hypothetical protein WCI00_06575 [bacterium]
MDARYDEPNKIDNILKKMRLDKLYTEALKSTKFANRIVIYLRGYNLKIKQLDPLYQQASECIAAFDAYFLQERKYLVKYMQQPTKQKIGKRDMYEYIQDIQKNLDTFEATYEPLQTKMKSIANTFVNEQDRNEQIFKVDSFCDLFIQIYIDISEIQETYDYLTNIV